MTSITKADVVAKFMELHKKYYNVQGFLISNVPDELSDERFAGATWNEIYNKYASNHVYIRSLSATVKLFDYVFIMKFERPLKMDHHFEFEEYFGFGGHCKDFSLDRTVARFPSTFDKDLNIAALLLQDAAEPIDADYAKQAIMLLAIGGYVKYWEAVHQFEQWFTETGNIPECNNFTDSKELLTRIFKTMQITGKEKKE